jgi:hypothetical protein
MLSGIGAPSRHRPVIEWSCTRQRYLHSGILTYRGVSPMTVNIVLLQPLIALIAGILILIMPRLLNYIVAIYLIIIGLSGIWPHMMR